MKRGVFFLLLAFAFARVSVRADDAPVPAAPVIDPTQVRQHYQEVLARPQFREPEELAGDFPLRDWFSQWVTQLVAKFQDFKYAGQMSGLAWLLVTTMTVLSIAGLIYVLARLSRRSDGTVPDPEEFAPERKTFLSPRIYDQKLQEAIARGDWRAAWLATWMQFLSRLELRRLVEADRSRTNREYLDQLRAGEIPSSALPLLTGLVHDYDVFIYGLRPIDEPLWRDFRRQVDEAGVLLHLSDRKTEAPGTEEAS
jgi:hypothetical protein